MLNMNSIFKKNSFLLSNQNRMQDMEKEHCGQKWSTLWWPGEQPLV